MGGTVSTGRAVLLVLAASLVYVVFATFVTNTYYQVILTSIPIWAAFAVAWNIFSGYTGLISFGHAAFFGLGAYTVTLPSVFGDVTPWLGLAAAPVVGAIAAVVIGLPTFRLRGHYFALAMLAYPLALLYLFEWLGLQELTLPLKRDAPFLYMQFRQPYVYTALAVALLAFTLVVSLLIERSRFGLILQTIKQNEPAAQAIGINPTVWKLLAFVISGSLSAVVGGLYVVVLLIVTPNEVFGLIVSARALIFAMFGGIGTAVGPVVGAAILVPFSEVLHAELGHVIPGIQGIVYGIAIVLVTIWMPEGIYWRVKDRFFPPRTLPAPDHLDARMPPNLAVDAGAGEGPALSIRNVTCRFGGVTALDDVSFDVVPGSITGVVGPNGAGKTTLFNAINGYVSSQSTAMIFNGQDIRGLPTHRRCRLGIGRTFQVARVFDRLTVFDNVLAGATARIEDEKAAWQAAAWAIEIAGLRPVMYATAGSVTALQVRLIELARAIAGGPRMLLLDETLAGLAGSEIDQVIEAVRKIRDLGTTIVIIEHTMSAMVPLVDRMIVLDRGRVIGSGPPNDVVTDPRIIEAYLGPKWAARA